MVTLTTPHIDLHEMGEKARKASYSLANVITEQKNTVLLAIADALESQTDEILAANKIDLNMAHQNNVDPLYIRDRLDLTRRIPDIIADVRKVAALHDPVGEIFDEYVSSDGLKIHKRRVPIGVLGLIYEARPNVTVDVATLALKTGNAIIMRGGSEVLNSNITLVKILRKTIIESGLPGDVIQYIESTDRQYVGDMLRLHEYIDMIIPRGGNELHTFCRENSTIPVITGGMGICHLYVDPTAKLGDALKIIHNAKTQRPAVCNALDTLLVNKKIATEFLPKVIEYLRKDHVTFRADPIAYDIVGDDSCVQTAGVDDFDTEWYALILGLKVVDNLDEAIQHIRNHSTYHSDGILTQNMEDAERFLNEVDSAAVYVNASTRFTDGSALGLGAEVAISTQKLHARGPLALRELTSYKWIIRGQGHIRL